MKTVFYAAILVFALIFSMPTLVQAQSACGGTVEYSGDLASNRRPWAFYCCPSGYRVQGVAYTDIHKQDYTDAVTVVCRSIERGNDVLGTGDLQKSPVKFVCDNKEVMAGIFSKDVMKQSGKMDDALDGLTAVCQKPNSKELRTIYNQDIQGGREGYQQVVYLPKRVVGLACKDLDKGGRTTTTSDRSDGCTIITK